VLAADLPVVRREWPAMTGYDPATDPADGGHTADAYVVGRELEDLPREAWVQTRGDLLTLITEAYKWAGVPDADRLACAFVTRQP
jgi:hypothetical protein